MSSSQTLDIIQVNECPETDFKHLGKCPIETCQFNTNVTNTGCLARDRFETSNKTMSDSEMYLYKMPDALNVRQVATKRKSAIRKVKNLIFLSFFIFYIKDTYSKESGMKYKKGISNRVDTLLDTYPLNIDMLKFEPWILTYLVDDKTYNAYIKSEVPLLSTDISLKNMLNLTPKKLVNLRRDVLKMTGIVESSLI